MTPSSSPARSAAAVHARGLGLALLGVIACWILFQPARADSQPGPPWLYIGLNGPAQEPLVYPTSGFDTVPRAGMDQRGQASVNPSSVQATKDASPFPAEHGSLVVWFRPDHALSDTREWLVSGAWASFDIQIRNGTLLVYVTADYRKHLRIPLSVRPDAWANRWHLLVVSWRDHNVEVFLDGTRLASRADVTPIQRPPSEFHIGYSPGPGQEPARGPFAGEISEVAILDRALRLDEVARLHRAGPGLARHDLLAASGIPVIVGARRRAWVRGEMAILTLTPIVEGRRIKLVAQPVAQADSPQLILWQGQANARSIRLDTRDLRPGAYSVHAELDSDRSHGAAQQSLPVSIRILAERVPDFPVGLDALGAYPNPILEQAHEWGLSFVSAGAQPLPGLHSTLDRLLFHGLGLIAGLNIHHQRRMGLPQAPYFDDKGHGTKALGEDVLQMLVLHGDHSFSRYSSSLGSPFSPIARAAMRQQVKRYLESAGDHPGLIAIAFDDEYSFRVGTDKATGRRYYGDYSPSARAHFLAETGLQPPFPPSAPPGTVFSDELPYFRWREVIGMPGDATTQGLASSWADLRQVVQTLRPDVLTTTWSGGEYGELDVIMDYGYPAIWEPKPHFKVGHGRIDFDFDRRRARQRSAQPTPVWALLGWWSDDLSGQPGWYVEDFRLNTVLALAKGVKAINWHTAGPAPKAADKPNGGVLSRPELHDEMIRLGRWLRVHGPMYARLATPVKGRIAVLWSEDDRAGKVHRANQPLHPGWFYPALRIAGYEVDVVTDEHIMRGELSKYEALVLTDFDYASASLWDAIRAFSETGGKLVIADAATDLSPEGAVRLPFSHAQRGDRHGDYRDEKMPPLEYMAWMARQLREHLGRVLPRQGIQVDGSDYVAPFFLDAPGGRLLTLVNYHLELPQDVSLSLPNSAAVYVYDAGSGELLASPATGRPEQTWSTRIPPADARRYLVLDRPIERLTASVNLEGSEFVVRAVVMDDLGTPVRFPLPLAIALQDPECRPVPEYAQTTATDPSTGALELRFPRARLMDPEGRWHVRVTDAITGRSSAGAGCTP